MCCCGVGAARVMDVSMLTGVTALDLLRLQKMESAPRGLVLVVGCLGLLLGLADDLPEWEGCQKVLLAQPVRSLPPPRRSGAGAMANKPPSSLQHSCSRSATHLCVWPRLLHLHHPIRVCARLGLAFMQVAAIAPLRPCDGWRGAEAASAVGSARRLGRAHESPPPRRRQPWRCCSGGVAGCGDKRAGRCAGTSSRPARENASWVWRPGGDCLARRPEIAAWVAADLPTCSAGGGGARAAEPPCWSLPSPRIRSGNGAPRACSRGTAPLPR